MPWLSVHDVYFCRPLVGLQSLPLHEPELLLLLRDALPYGSLLLGAAGVLRERGVEGEFVERLWRSGDLVEVYPLLGDLVDV